MHMDLERIKVQSMFFEKSTSRWLGSWKAYTAHACASHHPYEGFIGTFVRSRQISASPFMTYLRADT